MPEEILKKIKRRFKRLREKKRKAGGSSNKGDENDDDDDDVDADDESSLSLDKATTADEFALVGTIRCAAKIQGFDFAPSDTASSSSSSSSSTSSATPTTLKILVSLLNNTVHEYSMDLQSKLVKKGSAPSELLHRLELQGHRGDVRAVAISSK